MRKLEFDDDESHGSDRDGEENRVAWNGQIGYVISIQFLKNQDGLENYPWSKKGEVL